MDRLQADVRQFFDDFVTDFASFDGAIIAQRYAVPYLAMRTDGSSELFSSAEAIAHYFQAIVAGYHARGCCACRYQDLQVVQLGRAAALGSVTWELLRADGRVLAAWRESYNLSYVQGRLLAFVSIDHADERQ